MGKKNGSDDIDTIFCRRLLLSVHKEIKKAFPKVNLKTGAWTHKSGRTWEFHGPDKFYWHGRAENAFDARYKGWSSWLKQKRGD